MTAESIGESVEAPVDGHVYRIHLTGEPWSTWRAAQWQECHRRWASETMPGVPLYLEPTAINAWGPLVAPPITGNGQEPLCDV